MFTKAGLDEPQPTDEKQRSEFWTNGLTLHFNVHKGAYLFETPAHVTVVQLCVWPKPPFSPQQHPKVLVRSAC